MHKNHKPESRWVTQVWSHYEGKKKTPKHCPESPLRWLALMSVIPQIACLGFFTDMNLQVCVFNGKAFSLMFLHIYFWIEDHTQTHTFFLCYFTMWCDTASDIHSWQPYLRVCYHSWGGSIMKGIFTFLFPSFHNRYGWHISSCLLNET